MVLLLSLQYGEDAFGKNKNKTFDKTTRIQQIITHVNVLTRLHESLSNSPPPPVSESLPDDYVFWHHIKSITNSSTYQLLLIKPPHATVLLIRC